MVAGDQIMHQSLDECYISHDLIRVSGKLECHFELIHKLLERALGAFDNLT